MALYRWFYLLTETTTTTTSIILRPSSLPPDYVRDYLGKPVPERWNQSGFTGARDREWQWYQLGHMQICTSPQTDNHTSTPPLSFLLARCPSCHPNNSIKATHTQSHFVNLYLLQKYSKTASWTTSCHCNNWKTRFICQLNLSSSFTLLAAERSTMKKWTIIQNTYTRKSCENITITATPQFHRDADNWCRSWLNTCITLLWGITVWELCWVGRCCTSSVACMTPATVISSISQPQLDDVLDFWTCCFAHKSIPSDSGCNTQLMFHILCDNECIKYVDC